MEPIVNRVAESDIEVFDLSGLAAGVRVSTCDLVDFMDGAPILREKAFRTAIAAHDWTIYAGQQVGIHCSADAIIPRWAFMLVASRLHGIAQSVAFGTEADVWRDHFVRALDAFDWSRYTDRIVVVKGCGGQTVPDDAYIIGTARLQDVARKVMFGEPCSSVPLWRRPASGPMRG